MLVQEGVIHRDMLGKGCFGPLCSLSLLVWFSHESTSKSHNQKKKRGRMDLAVRSPSWLETQIHPDFITAFPVLLSELDIQPGLCVFAPWSECCARQTDSYMLLKIQSDHEFRAVVYNSFCRGCVTSLPQKAAPVLLLSSCSCVTSLLLISSFPSLHLITLVFESAFGANSHTCCQREAHVPAA